MVEYFKKIKEAISQPQTTQQLEPIEDIKDLASIITRMRELEAKVNENIDNITSIHSDITGNIIPQMNSNITAINNFPALVKNEVDKAKISLGSYVDEKTKGAELTLGTYVDNKIKGIEQTINTTINNAITTAKIDIKNTTDASIHAAKIEINNIIGKEVKAATLNIESWIYQKIGNPNESVCADVNKGTVMGSICLAQNKATQALNKSTLALSDAKDIIDNRIPTAITLAQNNITTWVKNTVGNTKDMCASADGTIMKAICDAQTVANTAYNGALTVLNKLNNTASGLVRDFKAIGSASVTLGGVLKGEMLNIKNSFTTFGAEIKASAEYIKGNMLYLKDEFFEAKNQIALPLSVVNTYAARCRNDHIIFLPYNLFMAIYWGFLR